jgi:uncharacterized protein YecT (DUF1311 family)
MSPSRLALAVLGFLAFVPSALAQNAKPSFDCATAREGAEIAICRNAKLARLDREIARVYGEVANVLTGAARQRMRDDQRLFLGYRDSAYQASRDTEELEVALQNRRDFLQRVLDNRDGSDAAEGYYENALGMMSITPSGDVFEVTVQTAGPGGRWICEATVTARRADGRLTGKSEDGLRLSGRYGDGNVTITASGVEQAGVCGHNGSLDGTFFYIGETSP